MARWSTTFSSWTPTAVADSTNFTSSGFHCLQGGVAGQRSNVLEFYLGGQATSSTVNQVVIARDSTVGATLSGGTNAALDPATAALTNPAVGFGIATTKPQRSATLYLLTPSFNAFGGVVRWVAAPGEEIGILGVAVNTGEISISTVTGAGLMGSHMIFEVF